MEFRVLGPLEVIAGENQVPLGGTKQRALLARLLLESGRPVAADRLVDDLWGEAAPETAKKMIQIYVSRLRKLLPEGSLQTRAPGYQLTRPPGSLDVEQFERIRAGGRLALEEGRYDDATRALREALALWRGPPLADFADEPFAGPEAARLEELRTAVLEERIQADLELGHASDVVAELEALVAEHPLRERLRGQLMLALYRSRRQADALAVFRDTRHALSDELGLEPSQELRDLELRILRQDPTLETAAAATPTRRLPMRRATVRYARSGDLNIAYQLTGDGPIDLVLISGFISHLEKDWEEPRHARFLERLSSVGRLIRFDKRGTGLSDRPPGLPDLETRMDDVRAVMDAVDSRDAVLFGYSEGAPMAILFAASYPERTRALILYGAYAKRLDPDDDYPWAPTREARAAYIAGLERDWGFESDMKVMCPSADDAMARWWGERCRAAASPGAIRALNEMNSLIDVRALLPAIRVPTLVLNRGTDFDVRVDEGRYIAKRIPGARFVELPGADHFVGVDPDQILDVVEPFLAECRSADVLSPEDRVLVTLLAAEIVGSTEKAAIDEIVRTALTRYRGREIERAGHRLLASFDGPARAVRCANAIMDAARAAGLSACAGAHTGEVEIADGRMRGIALQLAAGVAAEAAPGEVLVSQTVKDLVAGSGLAFADRGSRTLPGVAGEWRLLELIAPEPIPVPSPLVGRTHELERLEDALRRARSGAGATVLVAGEAGIGKTQLVSELATRARATGITALVGRCLDLVGTELPYQPFVEALRPAAAELPFVDRQSAGSQLRVFEETLALVDRLAPVMLTLEDLHWAGTSTLDLLVYLAHNVDRRRVLLLATYRTDEPGSAERVRRLADSVGRSGSALMLELGPLAAEELTTLLAALAGAPQSPALAMTIVARAEGNPFFAEELLAAARIEGGALPRRLRDLLLHRVARLDPATNGVLRLAAAAGRDVGHGLLRAAAALSERDVRESLRQAVEHGVLVADRATGSFRFRHALLAEAIYATLLPGEREAAHARLAEELARGDPPAAAAELAPHWAAAGRTREALVASIAAAREAESVFGLAEALAHLERALALWADVPEAAGLVGLDLTELSSWAAERAMLTGAAPRAVELAQQAITLLGDSDPVRAGLLHERLGYYLLAAGNRDAGVTARERAVELVPPEPPSAERAQVLAAFGHALMLTWRHDESRTICEQALALVLAVGAVDAELRALAVLGIDLACLGHGEEGLERLWRALRLATERETVDELVFAYVALTDVLTMLARPRESARLAAAGADAVRRYGIEHGAIVTNRVEALVAAGEWDEADRVSAAALRATTGIRPHQQLFTRAELEIGRGEFDAARAHLEGALATVREDERGSLAYDPVAVELTLWEGRWTDADEAVRDGLARARAGDAALFRVQLCAQGLRAHAELAALARDRSDADALRGHLARARKLVTAARRSASEAAAVTPNATGWRALAEAEYGRALGQARPQAWSAAAGVWDQLERPPLTAYCRWRQAEALAAAGADASVPLQAAHAVAARIGARPLLRELERVRVA